MGDHVGEQLGNYHLLRLLGRGGFAEVYLGEHVYLQNRAAVKVLHARLSEEEAARFVTEARTLAHLSHPHIVRVLDFAVHDGLPFLVMEYAPGGSLRTRHPAGTRLPLDTIVTYVSQVASALQYAHDRHLMHRDVKPENMLLDAREQVLLADFGLALLTPIHPASTQAMDPAMAGTAPYLAPEQVQGTPRAASDQYALGVVVYEWLSGQRPFRGTPIEVAMQHVSAPPPSFHQQVPDLSPAVEEVVLRALAKEPELRFPSVQDFATALQQAAHSAGYRSIDLADLVQPQAQAQAVTTPGAADALPGEREQQDTSGDRKASERLWKVPATLTPLVGREQDVAAICTLLSRPEVRLLTLLGVGGIGKTRLAIQVASEVRERFTDGVCFVGLASISDPSLVISSIAHELGLQEGGAQPLVETVKTWLRDKQFLLLLDNFEQIISAAPLLEELLATCPRLFILVTSREVLHLSAEQLFPVPPLALPDLAQHTGQEELAQYAAVSLFVQRARAIKPDFTLTQANERVIAEICVRLDGLPLALELAAARIRVLPPQALLTRLLQRFQVLTGGSRTLPERQQTLRSTIQWSYDLLDKREKQLFRRLSVFVGGCTLEAAEAVCGAGGDAAPEMGVSVLDGVASLIDKSLLQQTEQEGEEPQLAMLETIREYGWEALAASGELEVIQEAHALYYLALAERAESHLRGTEQGRWFARLEREQNNLRAALAWLLEGARLGIEGEEGKQQAERALRLCVALSWFWDTCGRWREGWTFLEQGLTVGEDVAASVRARALCAAAELIWAMGDMNRAQVLTDEGLAIFRALGDTAGMAHALEMLAVFPWVRSQYAVARSQLEEAKALFEEVGDTWKRGQCLTTLARIATAQGEYVRARTLLEESREIYQGLGDQHRVGMVLYLLARVLFLSGSDQIQAEALAEQSQALLRKVITRSWQPYVLNLLGHMHLQRGERVLARELFEASVATVKETSGDRWATAEALIGLARVAALQGEVKVAGDLYQESLTHLRAIDNKEFIPACLEGLASIVAAKGEPVWAAHLWGAAESLREAISTPLPPVEQVIYEHAVASARTQLGEKSFTAAWAEGRTMTPEQALAAQGSVTMPTTAAGPSSVPHAAKAPTYPAGLTTREVEVLRLVAQGLTDAQIAEQLVISPRTVNFHLTSIYGKIGVSSRAAATRYAMEQHLI